MSGPNQLEMSSWSRPRRAGHAGFASQVVGGMKKVAAIMPIKFLTAVLLLGQVTSVLRADGCKFRTDGRLVPEREQLAVIDWENGFETLHVATLSDPTADGNIWIVPVRAVPHRVVAEPVDDFPMIVYYETLSGRAKRQLREAISVSALLDSGGFCCPFFVGGCSGTAPPKLDREVSRVERLGMIVTVITATSKKEIEEYLDAQGVNSAAADLSSLDPYFGQHESAFACGWVAKRGEPMKANGMRIVFPSPNVWFPLRATQAYHEPVETVVYVRGFMKPAEGCDLPGLRCQYIEGVTEKKGLQKVFAHEILAYFEYHSRDLHRFTRVTLTTDPQQWNRDLELIPGTTPVGTVSLLVIGCPPYVSALLSSLLGAGLGLFIPLITIAKAQRSRTDWWMGGLIGGCIILSIFSSVLVFTIWRWRRFRDQPRQPRRYLVLPLLATVHFGIVYAFCNGLMAWIAWAG